MILIDLMMTWYSEKIMISNVAQKILNGIYPKGQFISKANFEVFLNQKSNENIFCL